MKLERMGWLVKECYYILTVVYLQPLFVLYIFQSIGRFRIQVVTLAELVGKKGEMKLKELKNFHKISKPDGLPVPVSLTDNNETNQMEDDFFMDGEDSDKGTVEKLIIIIKILHG